MSLRLITFKTNHTIMGEIIDTEDSIIIKQPVQIVVQPSNDGPTVVFVPFISFSEEYDSGMKIHKSDILCNLTPILELVNQYSKTFGSGIQIAKTMP